MSFGVMDVNDDRCSTHLIDGDGNFNVAGIENFMKKVKLAECGLSYGVVSIMGPQSSGKSTLLNHLFHTNFKQMDPLQRRTQTTKGIWLARCVGSVPCTLIMDVEGTDGRERGEDDTAFEKQSALFALAVSDIVLINMWCHDIGREQAANKPLLKTVFQVMMRLFSPRKTTLMFVIRDKSILSLEYLDLDVREDIQKTWDSIPKPQAHQETPLSEFFNVEVVALSSFEANEEQFKEQVGNLRQRLFNAIGSGGLAEDRQAVVPASGFSFSVQQIWKVIKENKDLNLPAHKVMVATVRCDQIANEKYGSLKENKEWRELEEEVQSHAVHGFGRKLSSILDAYLSEYDSEAIFFYEGVRTSKRKQLEEKLLQLVEPAYHSMLGHIGSVTLKRFKTVFEDALHGGKAFSAAAHECTGFLMSQFDKDCADAIIVQASWDSSQVRDKLGREIDACVAEIRTTKLADLSSLYEAKLNQALSGPVEALLDGASDDMWPSIRRLFWQETVKAISEFSDALSGFEIDEVGKEKMISKLKDYARGVVEGNAKEEAGRILIRMMERFSTIFSQDADSMPRVWTGKEDIQAIKKTARVVSLKLLSVMAAIRLDDETDNIEKTLSLALVDTRGSTSTNKGTSSLDHLASSTWDEIPSKNTLITPVQCKNLWRQFKTETKHTVTQAIAAQFMAATVKCLEIANGKCSSFRENKEWRELEEEVRSHAVHGFGRKLSSILDAYLSEYDSEAIFFDVDVRTSQRKQLNENLLQLVHPTYQSLLGHIRSVTTERLKTVFEDALKGGEAFSAAARECIGLLMSQFDKDCADAVIGQASWDSFQVREDFRREIEIRTTEIASSYEEASKKKKNLVKILVITGSVVGGIVLAPLGAVAAGVVAAELLAAGVAVGSAGIAGGGAVLAAGVAAGAAGIAAGGAVGAAVAEVASDNPLDNV